jgi:hypothetical protein
MRPDELSESVEHELEFLLARLTHARDQDCIGLRAPARVQ